MWPRYPGNDISIDHITWAQQNPWVTMNPAVPTLHGILRNLQNQKLTKISSPGIYIYRVSQNYRYTLLKFNWIKIENETKIYFLVTTTTLPISSKFDCWGATQVFNCKDPLNHTLFLRSPTVETGAFHLKIVHNGSSLKF